MQHGAFPLRGDIARILQGLSGPQIPPERVRRRAATLGELLGREVSWREAADAVSRGFTDEFGIEFRREGLTENEKTRADELARGKYGSEEWTCRF